LLLLHALLLTNTTYYAWPIRNGCGALGYRIQDEEGLAWNLLQSIAECTVAPAFEVLL
jgi:hypothetical protein